MQYFNPISLYDVKGTRLCKNNQHKTLKEIIVIDLQIAPIVRTTYSSLSTPLMTLISSIKTNKENTMLQYTK